MKGKRESKREKTTLTSTEQEGGKKTTPAGNHKSGVKSVGGEHANVGVRARGKNIQGGALNAQ